MGGFRALSGLSLPSGLRVSVHPYDLRGLSALSIRFRAVRPCLSAFGFFRLSECALFSFPRFWACPCGLYFAPFTAFSYRCGLSLVRPAFVPFWGFLGLVRAACLSVRVLTACPCPVWLSFCLVWRFHAVRRVLVRPCPLWAVLGCFQRFRLVSCRAAVRPSFLVIVLSKNRLPRVGRGKPLFGVSVLHKREKVLLFTPFRLR